MLANLLSCRGVEMLNPSSALIYVPIRPLVLASGSTNYLQKPSKIEQFSRGPRKIAFVTRKCEIFSDKAEGQNRRRHSQAISRTHFGLTTPAVEIAAIRSKNEFFEVPFIKKP
jgi:hypothetical protein